MRAALAHRGPDEGGTDAFGRCVLGHQRLRVLDLETGQQPVLSESGEVVVVFNGELYNFRELRRELAARGHNVAGTGDTAVIPHLYEEDGLDFVERLAGMFAIAIWDRGRERLVLARDRVGEKPLLWTRLPNGAFAFASELKALLRLPGMRARLDAAAIDAYLALQYVPGDRTALDGVAKLPPGHLLVLDASGVRVDRYWQANPIDVTRPEPEVLERVRESVQAAVRRRLVADVPVGALLSGGIDSSIVVALMAEASSGPVRTFTVGFPDPRYDERIYARELADRYSTDHNEVEVEPDVASTLPRLAATLDEPLGDEAALPLYLLCEAARRDVVVALTGDGGDEAFAGYERYAAHALAGRIPVPVAHATGRVVRALRSGRSEARSPLVRAARFLEAAAAPAADRYGKVLEVFPEHIRDALWTQDARPAADLLGAPRRQGITGLQLLDVDTYLPGDLLLKADLVSMAHSLELRSPFLDHEVLELGIGLPNSLKVSGRTAKIALRRAFASELPARIRGRRKLGFGVPLARWFRVELHTFAEDVLLDAREQERGLFRPEAVRRLLGDHAAARADHGHRLWCLVMLALWLRTHVDGAGGA
jgi:asparagine synthase (glutamine-hydrolysing)